MEPNINLFGIGFNEIEGKSNNPSELFELRSYLMAKLLWNPNLDSDLVIKDFTNG